MMPKRGHGIPRRLERRHLPFTIRRRPWAQLFTLIIVGALLTLPVVMVKAAISTHANPATFVIAALCTSFFVLASVIGLDRSVGYRLVLDVNGFTARGLLFSRTFGWDEVTSFAPRPNYRLPGYYASWTVDGSHHPRRHWSSLWFGFYEVPPLMEVGGKELTRLLRHAKRRADSGWADSPPRKTRNST